MQSIKDMDEETIMSEEVFIEVFDEQDEIKRAHLLNALIDQASKLKIKSRFEEMVKVYKKVEREAKRKERQRPVSTLESWTNFDGDYDNMFCGGWLADEAGVKALSAGGIEDVACYHPILPVERLKNLETGEEQIKIAYKRNRKWDEIIVPKTIISSANKIVALSGRGVAVTSETARHLVKYLADVENGNDDYIKVQYSTSKLGWNGNDFIPYDTDIIFDGDTRFKQAFESVSERGVWEDWLNHMLELRKMNRFEMKFMLAASFSSILVHLLGGLPFVVDLWGETEGGKTVSLMVAASVWANPDESRFIGDFKTTDVALEAKADMLNHLPMLLDDTSKTSARIRDNFEGVVYDLCSGKGKSRSNKELGINRENRWKNVILTNGERPLNSYVSQGGAINRILEVECGSNVYQDPQRTAEIMKKNYGFAGRRFVEIVKELDVDTIKSIQQEFQSKLQNDDKMQKQSISLSIVLTADKIVTDRIFRDGQYISVQDAKRVLIDRNELSDNERCYHYILDKVAMNRQRFNVSSNCEKWGIIEDGYAVIYNQAFKEVCNAGGFSDKSFLSWADKKNLIKTQGDRLTKVKKVEGNPIRCVFLKLNEGIDEDGFEVIEGEIQEKLPFD